MRASSARVCDTTCSAHCSIWRVRAAALASASATISAAWPLADASIRRAWSSARETAARTISSASISLASALDHISATLTSARAIVSAAVSSAERRSIPDALAEYGAGLGHIRLNPVLELRDPRVEAGHVRLKQSVPFFGVTYLPEGLRQRVEVVVHLLAVVAAQTHGEGWDV